MKTYKGQSGQMKFETDNGEIAKKVLSDDQLDAISKALSNHPYIKSVRRFIFWQKIKHPLRGIFFVHCTNVHGAYGKQFNRNNIIIKFLRKSNKICQWMTRLEIKWENGDFAHDSFPLSEQIKLRERLKNDK